MAKITLDGIDDVIRTVTKLGAAADGMVDKMLNAGGLAAKEKLQDVLEGSHRHILTGSMHDNTGYTDPKSYGSARQVTVYPRGKDKKGTSNALKGFVLNYGSPARGIVGDAWFDYGVNAAEPQIESEMRRVFEENIDKIMEE